MIAPTNSMGPVDNTRSLRSALRALPYRAVEITGGFWARYQETNRTMSLPHGFAMLEEAGNLRNLRIAAGMEEGAFAGFLFADSDIYKWLEAVAWELGRSPDATLQAMADTAIGLVQAAQEEEGYLDSYYQIAAPAARWTNFDHGHELYCAGHLIQAAIAFHRALDDDRLLAVALRFVDHIEEMFGPGRRDETCGHPEIEMALVELFRVTGEARHLALAQLFVDRRGRNRMGGHAGYGPVYQQDHVPVREANEVAGHAVRQLYLTTGVTDLYMERGEHALMDAMLRLWADMTQRKLYVTGGIGSRFDGESFGAPYELPADTCYCETCAAIASLMWNWRLLLVTGHSRYADLFERTLYNGVLSSPGLEGASYLYVNPLHVRAGRYVRASTDNARGNVATRPAWHSCACCPPNVMRILSSLNHYLATASSTGIQVHQYAASRLDLSLDGKAAVVEMETGYPWDGEIALTVRETPAMRWSLALRVPAWCRGYAVTLNGNAITPHRDESGYLVLDREWRAGDALVLTLEMQPAFIMPNPRVDAVRGCVAVERGPLVYCVESHDQPAGVDLLDVQVATAGPLETVPVDLLGNPLIAIRLSGRADGAWQDALYRPLDAISQAAPCSVPLTAIPYFAWGNRGMDSMRVWSPQAPAG
ncbi:MAG: glycoside hydrolase family 127 protein [Caldilineaceae bacterium]|nr:glycoside hydrolase family 127 protein [Caldilineaceae bacterium]